MPNIKVVGQLELLYIAGESVKWYIHFRYYLAVVFFFFKLNMYLS